MTENELYHHGVLGQKWGVRRYQNEDGSLTALGKRRRYMSDTEKQVVNTEKDVQSIVDSMSKHEQELLGVSNGQYMLEDEVQGVAKRFIKKHNDTPVAFLDIYYGRENGGTIAIGTKSGEDYRGKGYASDLVTKAQKWLESPEAKDVLNITLLDWYARRENDASIDLAKKYGFTERKDREDDSEWFVATYGRKKK